MCYTQSRVADRPRRNSTMPMPHLRLLLCLLSLPVFPGCATWSHHGVQIDDNGKYPISVLPIEVTADIDRLADITTVTTPVADEGPSIQQALATAAQGFDASLAAKLARTGRYTLIQRPPVITATAPPVPDATPWSAADFANLAISADARAVLRVKLVGYGKLKKEWLHYLIGSGIAEGLAQGVIAARLVGNGWVGAAVALEEIIQEILTWGGGAYLFNAYYSPVILESELISTRDGTSIWSDSVFVSADKAAINELPAADREKKQLQLRLTGEKALDELCTDLAGIADRNLAAVGDQHLSTAR